MRGGGGPATWPSPHRTYRRAVRHRARSAQWGTTACTPTTWAPVGVVQVERLLRTIEADPQAPRLVAVTGPGGSGKTLALRSLQTLYARNGNGRGRPRDDPGDGPLIVDDVHALGDDAVRRIVTAAHRPGAQVTVAFRPWPVERGLGELRDLIGEHGTTVSLDSLDRGQVEARARHRLGRDLDRAAVDALTACTGGVLCLVDAVLDGADGVGPQPWDRPGVLAAWDPVRRLAGVGDADLPLCGTSCWRCASARRPIPAR